MNNLSFIINELVWDKDITLQDNKNGKEYTFKVEITEEDIELINELLLEIDALHKEKRKTIIASPQDKELDEKLTYLIWKNQVEDVKKVTSSYMFNVITEQVFFKMINEISHKRVKGVNNAMGSRNQGKNRPHTGKGRPN